MALRVLCLGRPVSVGAFEHALQGHPAAELAGTCGPNSPPTSAMLHACDIVCVLNAVPIDTLLACANARKNVLADGPPVSTADQLGVVASAFDRTDASLVVTSSLRFRAPIKAARDAVKTGRVGAPVYLRYGAEAGDADDLSRHIFAALEAASDAMGSPVEIYACAVPGPAGSASGAPPRPPTHVSLFVRFADDSVALLGIGASGAGGGERAASVLVVGDQGAAENATLSGGALLLDETGEPLTPSVAPVQDYRADSLRAWIDAALPLFGDLDARAGVLARARLLLRALGAVSESLITGQPAPVAAS